MLSIRSHGAAGAALAFAMAFASGSAAHAAAWDVNTLLNEFNVIVLEDLDVANQHVDGRVYVGRDLKGTTGSVYLRGNQAPASSFDAAYVGRNASGVKVEQKGSAQIGGNSVGMNYESLDGGTVSVGGNLSNSKFGNRVTGWVGGNVTSLTMEGGSRMEIGANVVDSKFSNTQVTYGGASINTQFTNGSTETNGPISASPLTIPAAADMRDLLTETSEALGAMAATSTFQTVGSKTTISAAGSGMSVVSMTGAEFNAMRDIAYALEPNATLVINVHAEDMDLSRGSDVAMFDQNGKSDAARVLWNFIGANSFHSANVFVGAILAPDAAISGGSSNEGTVLARSLTLSNGEWHQQGWTGGLDLPDRK